MNIGFYSTLEMAVWGGSEELWSQSAAVLARQGHKVSANVGRLQNSASGIERLRKSGADVWVSNRDKLSRRIRQAGERLGLLSADKAWLSRIRPDLVVISVSWHLDELRITQACSDLGIPYVLLVQAASSHQSVRARSYAAHRRAFSGAAGCYFVSPHNHEAVETNLALNLENARIVDNAFNVAVDASPPWPDEDPWKLACVGRLNFQSKGQDILINVLKRPKWKSRPLQVSLWGQDEGSLRQINDLIELHGLENKLEVRGFAPDITKVWAECHALVLPSRYEGNSLAMMEAMICARVPIVTDVGRARELVDDNQSGFIAPTPTTDGLEDAMERAWNNRSEWRDMGRLAKASIQQRHSMSPANDFADLVLEAASGVRERGGGEMPDRVEHRPVRQVKTAYKAQ